jgi:hypothetical protein
MSHFNYFPKTQNFTYKWPQLLFMNQVYPKFNESSVPKILWDITEYQIDTAKICIFGEFLCFLMVDISHMYIQLSQKHSSNHNKNACNNLENASNLAPFGYLFIYLLEMCPVESRNGYQSCFNVFYMVTVLHACDTLIKYLILHLLSIKGVQCSCQHLSLQGSGHNHQEVIYYYIYYNARNH